ncbi:hypothetical protein GW17_00059173, partial [Ensete ventricosum]
PREQSPSAAHSSVRDEVVVPSVDRKHKPKQSRALTHARKGTQAHSPHSQAEHYKDYNHKHNIQNLPKRSQ